MATNLADATATEQAAIETYRGLIAAKTKEVAVRTTTIKAKAERIGELGVPIVMMKEDLADMQKALAQDKQFSAELEKGRCHEDCRVIETIRDPG